MQAHRPCSKAPICVIGDDEVRAREGLFCGERGSGRWRPPHPLQKMGREFDSFAQCGLVGRGVHSFIGLHPIPVDDQSERRSAASA